VERLVARLDMGRVGFVRVCACSVLVSQGRGSSSVRQHGGGLVAKAQAWLTARVCTHVLESWHPRAAAWSCHASDTDIPGPQHDAAAEGRRRLRGGRAVRRAPATRAARRPGRGKGS
jgi:hypothetical protein